MRAQKITFILCIELSLKTCLNSVLSGDHHVARLDISAIYLSLHGGFVCETPTGQKPTFDPGGMDQLIYHMSHHLQAVGVCVDLLLSEGGQEVKT